MSGEDGVFLGVMTRRIDPANYEKFFASVALGTGAAISMFHRDGTMLARYPHVDELIGQKFKKAPLLQQILAEGGQQTLRVQSPIDRRTGSVRQPRSSRFPVVVVATNTITAALADWRAQTRFLVGAADAGRAGDRVDPVPDHPADGPAKPGVAAAAGSGTAAGSTPPSTT